MTRVGKSTDRFISKARRSLRALPVDRVNRPSDRLNEIFGRKIFEEDFVFEASGTYYRPSFYLGFPTSPFFHRTFRDKENIVLPNNVTVGEYVNKSITSRRSILVPVYVSEEMKISDFGLDRIPLANWSGVSSIVLISSLVFDFWGDMLPTPVCSIWYLALVGCVAAKESLSSSTSMSVNKSLYSNTFLALDRARTKGDTLLFDTSSQKFIKYVTIRERFFARFSGIKRYIEVSIYPGSNGSLTVRSPVPESLDAPPFGSLCFDRVESIVPSVQSEQDLVRLFNLLNWEYGATFDVDKVIRELTRTRKVSMKSKQYVSRCLEFFGHD